MRKIIIISGILLSCLAAQTAKAQEIDTETQVEKVSSERVKERKESIKSTKNDAVEKIKAEKPKFKDFLKESGNEADMDNASEERAGIVVEVFDKDGSVPAKYAEQVRGYLIDALEKRGRLDIVDPSEVKVNGQEYKNTSYPGDGRFKDSDRFEAIAKAGVRYVISGEITDYDNNEYHNSNGKSFHECTFSVRFTAYDLQEKEVLRTRNEKAAVHGLATRAKANEKLIAGFKNDYASFIDKCFKIKTTLKEVSQSTKKGVMKSCLINAGSSRGVAMNDNFDVYIQSTEKAGGDLKKLGRVKATKNIYSEFSECNVTAGAEKITDALAAGAELIFLSDDNTLIF